MAYKIAHGMLKGPIKVPEVEDDSAPDPHAYVVRDKRATQGALLTGDREQMMKDIQASTVPDTELGKMIAESQRIARETATILHLPGRAIDIGPKTPPFYTEIFPFDFDVRDEKRCKIGDTVCRKIRESEHGNVTSYTLKNGKVQSVWVKFPDGKQALYEAGELRRVRYVVN